MDRQIPHIAANLHLLCMRCFKEEQSDTMLSKCSGCKRVSYCGTGNLFIIIAFTFVTNSFSVSKCAYLFYFICFSFTDNVQADWRQHKEICKALVATEKDPSLKMALNFSLGDEPSTHIDYLSNVGEANTSNELGYLTRFLKRNLTTAEKNLIAFQPRCIAW